jgi:hypothetical protein
MTPLDQVMPVYHFNERHSLWIDADSESVWQALATITPRDLTVTRPLIALRFLGRATSGPPRPLLERGPVRMFELDAPRYAVGGRVARPWQPRPDHHEVTTMAEFTGFAEPGWTKFLTDFNLEPVNGGVLLSTETRGYSTDPGSRRRFGLYWAAIRISSGLIRRDLLRSIGRQARLGSV